MRISWVGAAVVCVSGSLLGCGGPKSDASRDAAEVPQPGAAVMEEDIGPPPEGQSEPPMETPPAPLETGGGADGETSAADRPADGVVLSMTTWDEAQQVVAAHAGRIVVLDLWSTSCVPCRREFPHLVRLHRDHGNDVACISYSMDYSGRASRPPESYRDNVLEFLIEQEATCANFLGTDDPDALHERLQLAAIPAVYVYDRKGKLRKRFDNEDPDREEFTYETDVIPFVEELLAEN
ncbi:MAG: TlpA family protein disulfide reductase [Planctomycetaceae bacterium]